MLITSSFSFILEWPGCLDFNSLSCSILQHVAVHRPLLTAKNIIWSKTTSSFLVVCLIKHGFRFERKELLILCA